MFSPPLSSNSTLQHDDYTVAWICPLQIELIAALEMLDQEHPRLPQRPSDHNVYNLGSISGQNIVIVSQWKPGNTAAATVIAQMRMTFPNIRFGLLVGIGGGVPTMTDSGMIRLGDVVVSKPTGIHSGAVQYDHGKAEVGLLKRTGVLAPPPAVLLHAAQDLAAKRARSRGGDPVALNIERIDTSLPELRKFKFPGANSDYLYPSEYVHPEKGVSCDKCKCDPSQRILRDTEDGGNTENDTPAIVIHRGTIASGERVIKDGTLRDKLATQDEVLCFEMEAAGALADFPCLVIRGISDYCDSHKNDQWHGYAAAAAAAYARQIFFHLPIDQLKRADVPYPIENKVNMLVERSDGQERHAIMDWLSKIDYMNFQADYFDEMEEGTGQWFLKSDIFQSWIETPSTLFCPGIPGAGKTILTSMIVDYLQERFKSNAKTAMVAIFCTFSHRQDQDLVHFLANILKQLIQQLGFVPEEVASICSRGQRDSRPREKQMLDCLRIMTTAFSRIYLLVDALDECDEAARNKLIAKVLDLQENNNISFLATSRFIPEIVALFAGLPSLEINASEDDVRLYLKSRMCDLPKFVSRDPSLQELVCSTITELVGGMFLVAKLYIESLKKKFSVKKLKDALANMPGGSAAYNYAYEDAMRRIESQHPDEQTISKQVLCWLTCAQRPLTLTELQHALAVEPGESCFDHENLSDIQDIITPCAGLVTFDERSHIIRLVHFTTQEYFQRTWTRWFPEGHKYITEVCVTYLSYDTFEAGACIQELHPSGFHKHLELRLRQNPLYGYASVAWAYHYHLQPIGRDKILDLLMNEGKMAAFSQMFWHERDSSKELFSQRRIPKQSSLHTAASLGLEDFISDMLREIPVDIKASCKETPLSFAAKMGHAGVARLLLDHGADPGPRQPYIGSRINPPLIQAIKGGHEAVVELLLDRIPDQRLDRQEIETYSVFEVPDFHDGDEPSSYYQECVCGPDALSIALKVASENGHTKIVELLLQRGAEVNPCCLRWHNPVTAAARNGDEAMVRVFIDHKFDINQIGVQGFGAEKRTPLETALCYKHLRVIQALLERGAIIESTALVIAAESGRIEIMDLLLGYGESLSSDNIIDLIKTAAQREHIKMMQHLTKNGILRDAKIDQPLLWAAKQGYTPVVEILLDHGFEIDETHKLHGTTALFLAAQNGHHKVLQALLVQGANENCADEHGQSPLMAAIVNLKSLAVEQLIKHNKSLLHHRDIFGRSPMLCAIESGDTSIVGMCLAGKVEECDYRRIISEEIEEVVTAVSSMPLASLARVGSQCLTWAAKKGHVPVVETLLERGIGPHSLTENGSEILRGAIIKGSEDLVRILLDNEIGLTELQSPDQTILQLAISCGHEAIVRHLLERNVQFNLDCGDISMEDESLLLQVVQEVRSTIPIKSSPLLLAVWKDASEIVKVLLDQARSRKVAVRNVEVALSLAIIKNHPRTLEVLFDSQLTSDEYYDVFLQEAIERKHQDVIHVLIDRYSVSGFKPNRESCHLAFRAAVYGLVEVLHLLISKGIDPNWGIQSKIALCDYSLPERGGLSADTIWPRESFHVRYRDTGDTPLLAAAANGHAHVVKFLLEKGANPTKKSLPSLTKGWNLGVFGEEIRVIESPLDAAIHGGHGKVVRLLLNAGCEWSSSADLNAKLLHVSYSGNTEMINMLLERGVDPNTCDEHWSTPLTISTTKGHRDIVKSLLVAGADPNLTGAAPIDSSRRSGKFSPLHHATDQGFSVKTSSVGIIYDLLNAGANVNSKDKNGRTPLSWAAELHSELVLQILLDAGSEIDSVDQCNRTPLFYATINCNASFVKLLLKRGSKGASIQTTAGRNPRDVARESKSSFIEYLLLNNCESWDSAGNTHSENAELSRDKKGRSRLHRFTNCTACGSKIPSWDYIFRCLVCTTLWTDGFCRECHGAGKTSKSCYDKLHTLERGYMKDLWEFISIETVKRW